MLNNTPPQVENTPASLLPDIETEQKKKLAKRATQLICTKGRPASIAYLTTTFIENAKLTAEVNRLRTLAGEKLIPTFEP